ncbi:hypothetical protein KCV87_34965 [Actinosynnema pretiosum subsp. pretiosum]|uniref:Uncharacterized protein n=1 Tax=Actinosynnema pretiosum subsp. pretiosum TaxID=103721 RepID=A0AA45R422_9PSEU|nr:hypothetical protein APASM_4158 [Actinosynnema pretiosum subsp. pretiosum]QUF04441.1 hypothetical protein KCV87_34965 [Actinosynnema pretiosum subsp. pretiosum]
MIVARGTEARRRSRGRPGALVAAALLLPIAACTSVVGSRAVPVPPDQRVGAGGTAIVEQVEEEDRPLAVAYAHLRAVDACGLLYDEPAMAKAFPGSRTELVLPATALGTCRAVVAVGEGAGELKYEVQLTLAANAANGRARGAPEQVAGRTALVAKDTKCSFYLDVDEELGLPESSRGLVTPLVEFGMHGGGTPGVDLCGAGRSYLESTAALWSDLPVAGEGRSSPELALATLDPCVPASALLDSPGARIDKPLGTNTCVVEVGRGGGQRIEVSFLIGGDPVGNRPDNAEVVVMGGRDVVKEKLATGCRNEFAWQAGLPLVNESSELVLRYLQLQTVQVKSLSCSGLDESTGKVLAAMGEEPPPAKRVATAPVVLGAHPVPPDAAAVGAPFDPCALGWAAFPEQVRHPRDVVPTLRLPDEGFATSCVYTNHNEGEGSGLFTAEVFWAAPDGFALSRTAPDRTTKVQVAGREAHRVAMNPREGTACAVLVRLERGVAGVQVRQGRFDVDVCQVATTVAEAAVRAAA